MDFHKHYEVAVVGGGIAGIAAAVQAARSGRKTVLLEKTVLPGGLATTGLVYIYLPLCDGNGNQVTFGLCEELIRRSIVYGPGEIPDNWKEKKNAPEVERFRCIFSPAAYMLALDEILEENEVDFWLDTLVCGAEIENGRVSAAIVENASGRGKISAERFVDASGDCVLARRAGIPCLAGENYLTVWALEYDRKAENSNFVSPINMISDGPYWLGMTGRADQLSPDQIYRAPDGEAVSRFMLDGRRLLRKRYQKLHADGEHDRNSLFALKVPAMPQFRKTFCIDAEYVLDSGENNLFFPDSIGMLGDWRKSGPVWEVPYRTLCPKSGPGGLLAAGRCTGARNDAWEITRVIPSAAMTGQVAGLAAALSLDFGTDPRQLDVSRLQDELVKLGFKLHLSDIGLEYQEKDSTLS